MLRRLGVFWLLAVGAFVVLGGAAVWMGGLNQDEGWYLYAANLVAEGQVPYRDFFYTQGPMLPLVYSAFAGVWRTGGILGARLFTLFLGLVGILFAVGLARRLVPAEKRNEAGLMVFLLLGCNLYHLYYTAIPKTYALAGLFVLVGFYLLSVAVEKMSALALVAGLSLAFAAGTRISLGVLLPVTGVALLLAKRWRTLAWLSAGAFVGLALVYGPFLADAGARAGLVAAQQYHAARGGFDVVWTVGSVSRLVRWYLPVFIVFGLGLFQAKAKCEADLRLLFFSFLAVFAVQMLAPFPYEDYQVPVMALLAVFSVVLFVRTEDGVSLSASAASLRLLLVLGLCFANSFGSPLLEKWSTNGQDRFWSIKKEQYELPQLRKVAQRVEALDPGGKELLTQDLYLAIETNRRVPKSLEMGPFAMLSDAEWRKLLTVTAPAECTVAALSGYTFAVEPPECGERSVDTQIEYWNLLKGNFKLAGREESFGQNATTLLLLKRK